jgi:hypothetical protein
MLAKRTNSRSLAVVLLLISPLFAQSSLKITSPADGTVVTAGEALNISVSAGPLVHVVGVLTDGRFPDLQSGSSSTQFRQNVPVAMTPGIYHLTAIGLSLNRAAAIPTCLD